MPISKVQVPSLTTPIDIRNGHSANVAYANEQFSAQVNTVNNPYVGLILSLYFPAVLDIESGIKQVSLTFGNSETYTTSFLILGYSYEYVVPVLIQIKSIENGVLTYDILHKGSVPSSSTSIGVEIDEFDDTQLNFDAGSNAQSTVVITYPDEDIEGTSYEVYAGSEIPQPTAADAGKVIKVNASGTGYELGDAGSGVPKNVFKCVPVHINGEDIPAGVPIEIFYDNGSHENTNMTALFISDDDFNKISADFIPYITNLADYPGLLLHPIYFYGTPSTLYSYTGSQTLKYCFYSDYTVEKQFAVADFTSYPDRVDVLPTSAGQHITFIAQSN